MSPGSLVRFLLIADRNHSGVDLVRTLTTALHGEQPAQNQYPESWDCYIEGSVQWSRDKIRVRLFKAGMADHIVDTVWRNDYLRSCKVSAIAQDAADRFWDSVAMSAH
jgi:hypothetical protein